MLKQYLFGLLVIFLVGSCAKKSATPPKVKGQDTVAVVKKQMYQADPTVFYHGGTYYLYGTNDVNADIGFLVYTSKDMKNWTIPPGTKNGYALINGDSYGTAGFWAPQVFYANNKFYMAYTANENIAIAQSDSPVGPFVQTVKQALPATAKQIDPFVFFDTDGKAYLYHVRLQNGNRIYVAELNEDYTGIKANTLTECITAVTNSQPWEKTAGASVTEGPTVIKRNGLYYLFYSANDFRSVDYAVGYAVSSSPLGPWVKYTGNPIISKANLKYNGPGHGDLFTDANGNFNYVLHVHNSATVVIPRKTAIVSGKFTANGAGADKFEIDPATFKQLTYTDK
ncbi:beta-xylosidase [Mucilaginibacter terrigena]|uniref:Beta-xylosidase n=1 Tax=Mucilaginibacter terrigena TaxID=2492395 RepID=A0A4Q5LNM6_9SPHI|nr:glycoside hydrolase family 43 protein [Mucilaginibacter terrigena]RYU90919.1 beta-xylosidase [Mucilaginibacter terrigena]